MNRTRWARVKEIFASASEVPAQERNAVLDRECGEDCALRSEVERLLKRAASANGLLDKPIFAFADDHVPLLKSGDIVAGRFTVGCRIGVGGMSEVYEAVDRITGNRVALKVLRQLENWPNRELLLRREVDLARRISHPNVCRVHELYSNDFGRQFLALSMELLEGRSLADIDPGTLASGEIEEIARQLCLGIDAAHAAGVVHRDLKPSNVIIVNRDETMRVVITDFGIARPAALDPAGTLLGGLAGTPLYMAPEQLCGHADHRSDLYALCIILYELIAGTHPFATPDTSEWTSAACFGTPDARMFRRIPAAWRWTLGQGLSPRPEDRFQSGEELLTSLRRCSWPHRFAARLLPMRPRRSVRRAGAAGAVICGVALAFVLIRPSPWPVVEPFSSLVFAGLQHPPTDDPVIVAAEDSFLAAIRQSPRLQVTATPELRSTFAHMGVLPDRTPGREHMREAALRIDNHVVLFGSVSHASGYTLHLEIETLSNDPRRPATVLERDFRTGDASGMFRAISLGSRWVRQVSGEGKAQMQEQDVASEDLTTPSWKALQLIREARLRRLRGDSGSALIFAEEALQADPGFPAAQSLRGDILVELREYRPAMEAYNAALQLVKARNISGRERYEIESKVNEDTADYETAIRTYKAWAAHFPNDYLPHFYLAGVLRELGERENALGEMETARKLSPRNFVIYPHLAGHYMAARRWDDVAACIVKLNELNEPNWAVEVSARLAFVRGDYRRALSLIEALMAVKDEFWPVVVPFYKARVLAESGDLQAARETLHLATSVDRQRGLRAQEAERRVGIAYLAWQQRDIASAREETAKAMDSVEHPDSIAVAGAVLARLGDVPGAMKVAARLGQWPDVARVVRARRRLLAEIAIARGDPRGRAFQRDAVGTDRAPASLDFALQTAQRLGNKAEVRKAAAAILADPDLQLNSISPSWWVTPGLLRLAALAQHRPPDSVQKPF